MAFHLQPFQIALLCVLLCVVRIQAKCSNPDIRREWRKLSKTERAQWIGAVKCLNKLPHDSALTPSLDRSVSLIPPVNTSSSFWDDISYLHMDLNSVVHFTGFFLPWHRAYVWGVENAMRKKCDYGGVHPYWDWTLDASDFYNSAIFDNNAKSGLGGWGDPNNDYQITTGGFGNDFTVSYPAPHNVRRNFTIQPFLGIATDQLPVSPDEYINTTFAASNVNYMVNSFVGDFIGFQSYFESFQGPHIGPHIILGGDMEGTCPSNLSPADCVLGPKWTPNDPLFFLHHAMVDKIWYDWQLKNESNQYAFQGGSVSEQGDANLFSTYPTGGPPFLSLSSVLLNDGLLWKELTISDVMDTTNNTLCYIYE